MFRGGTLPLVLPCLVVCAWLHVRGVSALVGADLAAPQLRPQVGPAPRLPDAAMRSADAILLRNPFDSVTGPLLPGPGHEETREPADEKLEPCPGVRVVSIVASDDPEWSLVMLDAGEREPILRKLGGDVVAIRPDRVLLDRSGGRCVARMFAPSAQPPSSPVPPVRGITRTGPGSFAVDRSARDALIEGAADLMRSVSVRPEKQGDDVIGLRIATLKAGTPLEALGLRAGDVLSSLDGIPLTAPDRMLEALGRVRTEEHVHLAVLRDGRPSEIDYDVR